jgi:predicted alpha/beta-hydrolase family hydrolase
MTWKIEELKLPLSSGHSVSALVINPPEARACYVFAHGAGAGMAHPFMERFAQGLAERGVATLRYQFLYMEQGGRRPDPPAIAHAVVRAAVAAARDLLNSQTKCNTLRLRRCCDGTAVRAAQP